MELLLNLLWLALLLPAVLIWRRQSTSPRSSRYQSRFRAIILLGCLLVLLFPVVSATDDLHPLSNEIEESNPCRRTVKHAPDSLSPDWTNLGSPPAQLADSISFWPEFETCGPVLQSLPTLSEQIPAGASGGRAPPSS